MNVSICSGVNSNFQVTDHSCIIGFKSSASHGSEILCGLGMLSRIKKR